MPQSNQFSRVSPGDVIWVVTVRAGELFLLGKLHVGEITDRSGAMKRLGKTNVWGAKDFYAIADRGTVGPLQQISVHDLAKEIRFESANPETGKLTLDDKNKVNAGQLQTMRILKGSSAGLLQERWQS